MSARPEVLGYPSPTTSRYVILAAALLASGLFIGNWLHGQFRGEAWLRAVARCQLQPASTGVQARLASQARFEHCMAGAERTRTAFAVGGAGVAALGAAVVLFAAPPVVRRRRRLRTPGPPLSGAVARFEELARDAGVASRVHPLVGTSRQRDAFSFGAPGRYFVALPPAVAVRWRSAGLFDPLVRHELAHVRQRDVALAWLTRSIGYTLVPILALPLVAAAVRGDASLLPDYLWRAALLGAVVALLSAALLRSREYGADLRAARWQGDPEVLGNVVGSARPGPQQAWRRLLARHPSPAQRVSVLRQPGLLVRSGFVDGLTGAFLGALAVPLVVGALTPLLSGSGQATRGYLVASVLLGPVLGASVGLAIWRAALFGRVTGEAPDVAPVATGVGIGLVAGQAVSLGQTSSGLTAGLTHPAWLVVSAVAGAGVTVLSAGLGQLWADAAPALGGQRACWVIALAVNGVLFSTLLWSTSLFQLTADVGGWALGRTELAQGLTTWTMFAIVVLLGLAAVVPALLVRSPAPVPAWLVEGPSDLPWPAQRRGARDAALVGLATGLAATVVIVWFRLVVGPAASSELRLERLFAYQWVVALAAGLAAAVVVELDPERGAGSASVAVPVGALVGSAGWFVLNVSLGARWQLSTAAAMVRPATVLGWYAAVSLVPVAYAASRLARAPARILGATVGAVVLSLVAGTLALRERDHLVAPAALDASALSQPLLPQGDASSYLSDVVPALSAQFTTVDRAARTVLSDPALTPPQKADLLESQVEPAATALVSRWAGYHAGTTAVARTHATAMAALRTAAREYAAWVAALRTSSRADLNLATQLRLTDERLWNRWVQSQAALAQE